MRHGGSIFKTDRGISVSETSSMHMANIFLDHWTVPFSILTYLLTENGPQFESKFFTIVRGYIGVKNPDN